MNNRKVKIRFGRRARGAAAAEMVLLACLLGAASLVVAGKLRSGMKHAAAAVSMDIAGPVK